MTSHDLARKLLGLPDRDVVTSDDPGDGYNFRAGGVKEMVVDVEGNLHENLDNLTLFELRANWTEEHALEDMLIVIIP